MGTTWDNKKYKWVFSPLGTGDKVGVNNAGIGIFKKQPYIGLAKEILQNVIDAKDPDIDEPAKACFEVLRIPRNEIPGAIRLSDVIKRCYDYYNEGDDGEKMALLNEAAIELLDREGDIPVLKISDYNTTGLMGIHADKGSNWTGLVREISACNKRNGSSGSFGVGKFAPFNFSRVRTIVYSTFNKEHDTAIQGKTILTTFLDQDKKLKQNVGLFGQDIDDDCKAIFDENEVPEVYRRNVCGTDLFVIGFKEEKEWMQQIAVSVIEYFFYTIYKGELEVNIKEGEFDLCINKNTLEKHMLNLKEYCDSKDIEFIAPKFFELLKDDSGKTKHFQEIFENKGEVELYLRMDPECTERKIIEMRRAGMKIQEDTNFRLGANFEGIFIATGNGSKSNEPKDNISSFLRKCENQAHDTWSKDEYEKNEEEAGKIIKKIHKWLVEKIKSQMPEINAKTVEAYGLSDLLPNQYGAGSKKQEESAFSSFKPTLKPILLTPLSNKKIDNKKTDIAVLNKNKKSLLPNIIVPDDGGDENIPSGGTTQRKHHDHPPYPGPYPGPFPGPNPVPNPLPNPDGSQTIHGRKSKENQQNTRKQHLFHEIPLKNIRTPYDSARDMYRVSFIPEKSVAKAYLRLQLGADDDNKLSADVKSAFINGFQLNKWGKFIVLEHLNKGSKIIVNVKLSNAKRRTLEVHAYVE